MNSLIGLGEPNRVEWSLHDSDIDTMNRVLCESVARVVEGCGNMGISFPNDEEEIMSSAI